MRPLPRIVAPTTLVGIMRHDGDVVLARAAADVGMPFCVLTQPLTRIEDMRRGAPQTVPWFQLCVWRDRPQTWAQLDRVARQGAISFPLTVDTPDAPQKAPDLRRGFSTLLCSGFRRAVDLLRHLGFALDMGLDREVLYALRQRWPGQLLIKGVLGSARCAQGAGNGLRRRCGVVTWRAQP